MKRRKFITTFGSAAVTWPLAASAQQLPVRPGAGDKNGEFADLIVSSGTILTQDPSRPKADALAVKRRTRSCGR
jgi:hypothetical protein